MKYPIHEEKIYMAGRDEGEFPNLPDLLPNLPKNKSSNRPSSYTTEEQDHKTCYLFDEMKRLALLFADRYPCNLKIEINVDNKNHDAKINFTFHDYKPKHR